jgi:PilZ domain
MLVAVASSGCGRSLWPHAGHRLELSYYEFRIAGTVERATGAEIGFRTDSRAAALVIKPGWQVSTQYLLAEGVIDARFTVTGAGGQVVRLKGTGTPAVEQRRQHPRVTVHLRAGIEWERPGWAHPARLDAYTLDLSLGGARLCLHDISPGCPQQGEAATLEIELPDGPLCTPATVRRAWDSNLAVRFGDLPGPDATRLAALVDTYLP